MNLPFFSGDKYLPMLIDEGGRIIMKVLDGDSDVHPDVKKISRSIMDLLSTFPSSYRDGPIPPELPVLLL